MPTDDIPPWAEYVYVELEDSEQQCNFVATDKTQFVECDNAEPFTCEVDEGEVLGEKDEPKKEVEVVLTETGANSNTFVYVIQTLLTVSTLLSGIFLSKKYIM